MPNYPLVCPAPYVREGGITQAEDLLRLPLDASTCVDITGRQRPALSVRAKLLAEPNQRVGLYVIIRWNIRLHEKGGKHHLIPCHHALAEALHAYINAAGIAEHRKGFLFRTASGHNGNALSNQAMDQSAAWRMLRRRTAAAGIHAPIGNHTFRATGITTYLSNCVALEHAQEMAAHESPRTTKLYDRTNERLTQDEVERIRL
jgi:integrase